MEEKARPLALSASRACEYIRCPLLYRFRSIDKLPEPKTIAQVMGTLVHACLENMHQWDREARTYPAVVKELKPTWASMCEKDEELRTLVPEEKLYDFLVQARSLVRGYFLMEEPKNFDAHACEMYVSTTLPNGVPVKGFIDRVDKAPTGEVRIVDYKTGKKPLPKYSHDAIFQMKFYALVYWRLNDHIPDLLRLMYLKVTDDLVLQPHRLDLEAFEDKLFKIWSDIVMDGKNGDFKPKKNALCNWCTHQSLCPVFGGIAPSYPGWPGSCA